MIKTPEDILLFIAHNDDVFLANADSCFHGGSLLKEAFLHTENSIWTPGGCLRLSDEGILDHELFESAFYRLQIPLSIAHPTLAFQEILSCDCRSIR